jgi:NADH:ubiquinone oxidoreductase subunit 6 (subunit J)
MLFGDFANPDVLAIMIPITAIAGGIAVAIVSIIMGARKKELEHKERLLAMEKGIEIPQPYEPEKRPSYRSNRTAGLVMTLLGIAIMVANWAVAGTKGGVWGLIPMAIGVGLLISSALEKKEVGGK